MKSKTSSAALLIAAILGLAVTSAVLVTIISLASRESYLDHKRTLILDTSRLLAVIETVEGDQMILRTLNTVSSQNNRVSLLSGSRASATIFFQTGLGANRREICVTGVQPFSNGLPLDQKIILASNNNSNNNQLPYVERNGLHCLGTIAMSWGNIGLPLEMIKPGNFVTISLNDHWKLETKETGEQP